MNDCNAGGGCNNNMDDPNKKMCKSDKEDKHKTCPPGNGQLDGTSEDNLAAIAGEEHNLKERSGENVPTLAPYKQLVDIEKMSTFILYLSIVLK